MEMRCLYCYLDRQGAYKWRIFSEAAEEAKGNNRDTYVLLRSYLSRIKVTAKEANYKKIMIWFYKF